MRKIRLIFSLTSLRVPKWLVSSLCACKEDKWITTCTHTIIDFFLHHITTLTYPDIDKTEWLNVTKRARPSTEFSCSVSLTKSSCLITINTLSLLLTLGDRVTSDEGGHWKINVDYIPFHIWSLLEGERQCSGLIRIADISISGTGPQQ